MKILITIVFALLMSTATQARMSDKMITCPSVDTIHQTASLMKNAAIYHGGYGHYIAMINDIEAKGLIWSIVAHDIIANNDEEVAMIAAKRSATVSHMVYPNARMRAPRTDEYSCLYYDSSSVNPYVSIIAIKQSY